ncbi:hypothetical protein H2198_002109 [Neophaeococcomyces mojaviensis]|uniref:Uncharacterized protein n=1 Tax=Neophaeococcomyces mojaviensis TaxID=3383035 RepID=A0ACC3AF93_9EURO|nr:hypothetical protein H2198_002109 [Knufia sp. JES_112]
MSTTTPKVPVKITMPSVRPATTTLNSKPWYSYITLDLLLHILSRSIFHPAIVLIFYLCIAAVPPHHHRHPLANQTLYYASFLLFIRLLMLLNARVTYGPARTVTWENEVVVITGGATGLGRCLVEMLLIMKKGVRVAVLDVQEADETARAWMRTGGEFEGRLWWGCIDVRNSAAVRIMAGRLKEELGRPTILINNAATGIVGLPLIPEDYVASLSPQDATKTITVNTISHFNTLSAFLGDMVEHKSGATIVTISSLLAHLSPSRLSDYSASKAALSSLHACLTHEIANNPSKDVRDKVKTVLVEPGMIQTQLFADITKVPWYANFFGPVLEVNDIAKAIIDKLSRGESGVIRMPFYSKCMPVYAVMPGSMQTFMRWFSGIDAAIVPASKKKA